MKTPERQYHKDQGVVYMGLPAGPMGQRILGFMEKAGWPTSRNDREYQFPSYADDGLMFRVIKPREIPGAVADGIVDFSIIGDDLIIEMDKKNDLEVLGPLPFSRQTNQPTKLVAAAPAGGPFKKLDDTKGHRFATELPRLTRLRLMSPDFGFTEKDCANIVPSLGKTEGKVAFGQADVIVDLTETGATLRANGFARLATLFRSYPLGIMSPEAAKITEIRSRVEGIFFLLDARLQADSKPSELIRVNVHSKNRDKIIALAPDPEAANILHTESDIVTIEFLVDAPEKREKLIQLMTLVKDGIAERVIASPIQEMYERLNKEGTDEGLKGK